MWYIVGDDLPWSYFEIFPEMFHIPRTTGAYTINNIFMCDDPGWHVVDAYVSACVRDM